MTSELETKIDGKDSSNEIYLNLIEKTSIHILTNYEEVDKIFKDVNENSDSNEPGKILLGFDAEWNSYKVSHIRPISLIQISIHSYKKNPHKMIDTYLIKMIDVFGHKTYQEYCENNLVKTLENDNIYKVGVNICYDKAKLFKDYQIKLSGVIELGNLYSIHSIHSMSQDGLIKECVSLADLTKKICGYHMPKIFRIRCSNWEETLTDEQINYAAADAFYALMIFNQLTNEVYDLDITRILNMKLPKQKKNVDDAKSKCIIINDDDLTDIKLRENSPTRSVYVPSIRPIYDNIKVLSFDGSFLFFGSKKKINWYVERGLADVIDSETIKLNFKPKGSGHKDSDYWTQIMNCKCVVCGSDKNLLRQMIVPRAFRTCFPEKFKTRHGYDTLAICAKCKMYVSNIYSQKINVMLQYYGVENKDTKIDEQTKLIKKIISLCGLLIRINDKTETKVPESIVLESNNTIKKCINKYCIDNGTKLDIDLESQLDIESIKSITNYFNDLNTKLLRQNKKSPEQNSFKQCLDKFVGMEFTKEDYDEKHDKVVAPKILEFEKLWRNYFVEKCKPKFLPKGWNIDYVSPIIKSLITS